MEDKEKEHLKAQLRGYKAAVKSLGDGIWGLKKDKDSETFTHEEIVFLFARVFDLLGFDYVKEVKTGFPDCISARDGKKVGVEFEPMLSSFEDHLNKHDLSMCNYIVCWRNDLPIFDKIRKAVEEHNIEVIELSHIYREKGLKNKKRTFAITNNDIIGFTPYEKSILRAFIANNADTLTKEQMTSATGLEGKTLGGAVSGFTQMERSGRDWLVKKERQYIKTEDTNRTREIIKYSLNPKYGIQIMSVINQGLLD